MMPSELMFKIWWYRLGSESRIWEPDRNWGYIQFNYSKEVTDEYIKYTDMLYDLIMRDY